MFLIKIVHNVINTVTYENELIKLHDNLEKFPFALSVCCKNGGFNTINYEQLPRIEDPFVSFLLGLLGGHGKKNGRHHQADECQTASFCLKPGGILQKQEAFFKRRKLLTRIITLFTLFHK